MARNGWRAGLLSFVVPGLGQWYDGRAERGAAILVAVLVVGNLNVLWLSTAAGTPAAATFYGTTLPRLLHDLFAGYGVLFWLWQVLDAYHGSTTDGSVEDGRLSA